MMKTFGEENLNRLYKPSSDSHKGQNGRLLVIGGSQLFHAAIFWSAEVAAKIVDLVHFTSPANENNELVRVKIKTGFWSGIVVDWAQVESYIEEDDCILIGPGMPRKEGLLPGEEPTGEIVNRLLAKFAHKRWVVDGGALQEMDKSLLNERMIVTPHRKEFERLFGVEATAENARLMAKKYGCTILFKGVEDVVCGGGECVVVRGGNPGMTKGGTGDVLAGLVASLYCKNKAFLAASTASLVNKKAGDELSKRVGVYFSAGDLVGEVAKVLAGI